MTTSGRRGAYIALALLFGGALGVFGWNAIHVPPPGEPVEIVLEARDVRFNGHNPPLRLQKDRPVRIVVRNAETAARPVFHDFDVAGMEVEATPVLAPGESAVVEFTPRRSGSYTYHCPLHPGLMNGRIVVE
jgi:heme/copper-type cytochrome/quinol oxidase subunit 2